MARSKKSPSGAKRGSPSAPSSRSAQPLKRVGGIKPRVLSSPPTTPIPKPSVAWGQMPKFDASQLGHKAKPAYNTSDAMNDIDTASYYLGRVICCERYDESSHGHQRMKGVAFSVPCEKCRGEALEVSHSIINRMQK